MRSSSVQPGASSTQSQSEQSESLAEPQVAISSPPRPEQQPHQIATPDRNEITTCNSAADRDKSPDLPARVGRAFTWLDSLKVGPPQAVLPKCLQSGVIIVKYIRCALTL